MTSSKQNFLITKYCSSVYQMSAMPHLIWVIHHARRWMIKNSLKTRCYSADHFLLQKALNDV